MTTRPGGAARWMDIVALAAMMLCCSAAQAQPQPADYTGNDTDPPVRVGRLSDANGEVSYSPAGSDEWVQAQVNRPLVTGDRVWADSNSRAEISVDNSTWWLGAQTSVTVSNLDDRIAQMQVQEGTLDVRVRQLPAGNIVEIDTPNLAFSLTRPGRYRVDVDPQDGSTTVVVREGAGEVYGENASYVIAAGQAYRFHGTDVSDSEFVALPAPDTFERWTLDRDRRYTSTVSARYVSSEVVGYEDLDTYGTWSPETTYGSVWFPRRVASDWAPYREGHWAWIDPWGWTWVDDEPWGFAPFHYGRWAHFSRGWGWVPGPRSVRPVYAPALVAFVGGAGFSLSVSSGPAIGWFPLAPREVYVPPYHVSRNYFRQVNVSNTVVNVTNITNIYNNPTRATEINYANRGAPNAVTAVPPAAFAQAQNVGRVAIAMPAAAIQRAEVHPVARVAPARPAFVGAAPVARAKPPAATMQRAVVAKLAPPAPPVPDAQKLQALAKNPGQPLSRAEVQTLRRATPPAAVAAPAVKVVTPAKPQANAAPPARAAGAPGTRNAPAPVVAPPGQANERPPAAGAPAPAAKGPPVGQPPAGRAPPPTAGERNAPAATARLPGAPGERPPANAGGARAPAVPTTPEERAAPSVARPPEARGRATPGGPAEGPGAPARPPVARPPEAGGPRAPVTPEERAAPATPPVARPPGQAARPPEARPTPAPQERALPQRPPEARAAPPRPPEARPQPPQERAVPQRPPEARPQPQPPPAAARPAPQPPAARPEPPRPPQAQPGPEGRPPPAAQKGEEKGKGNDKKDQNP
jgi:hypothetical protein